MLIVTTNALGFFTGSGIVIPFSVDLSDFCGCFRVESNTTVKIYVGHDNLLMNEVIGKNSLFEILATISFKVIFLTQNRMNCRLCRIIKRDLGFIVDAHRFMQMEKLFNFDNPRGFWMMSYSIMTGYRERFVKTDSNVLR